MEFKPIVDDQSLILKTQKEIKYRNKVFQMD